MASFSRILAAATLAAATLCGSAQAQTHEQRRAEALKRFIETSRVDAVYGPLVIFRQKSVHDDDWKYTAYDSGFQVIAEFGANTDRVFFFRNSDGLYHQHFKQDFLAEKRGEAWGMDLEGLVFSQGGYGEYYDVALGMKEARVTCPEETGRQKIVYPKDIGATIDLNAALARGELPVYLNYPSDLANIDKVFQDEQGAHYIVTQADVPRMMFSKTPYLTGYIHKVGADGKHDVDEVKFFRFAYTPQIKSKFGILTEIRDRERDDPHILETSTGVLKLRDITFDRKLVNGLLSRSKLYRPNGDALRAIQRDYLYMTRKDVPPGEEPVVNPCAPQGSPAVKKSLRAVRP